MSDRSPRDDEELETLLSELESTLSELRSELDDGRGRRRRRGPPRPPSVGDLLRFTNDYTIPTVIATLQATIEALELFRRFLELTAGTDRDGGRVSARDRSRLSPILSGAGERAASDASDALSQLRTALAEADLPEDEESRDVIEEARSLSEQIEERIAASRETVARERDRERSEDASADGAVTIDVTDGEEQDSTADGNGEGEDSEGGDEKAGNAVVENPEVDVEAELESIKRQLGKAESPDGDGAADDGSGRRDADEPDDDSDGDDASPAE
ncbi:hypothetical protein HUG10_03535 [Halorarum halophilum]|uniref:Uncharacterized protein n=1 Tax=Halorarum halophilum TaxID=2743090 RepID=A0A7D5GDI9_9EURY|nr:hypothetical protein [Halobaculum halophilum]QLG26668.1 hypothetical protein HUG10_03535 [Halobaculum halophilum]